MFYLSLIEHSLLLPPHYLALPINEAIKGELENLFLDKVIEDLGLCISVYDIISIDGGFVVAGEGAPTYMFVIIDGSYHASALWPSMYVRSYFSSEEKVVFRLIMFRPFVGEVISAKLKESDTNGLCLTLGFFDDIYIPVDALPKPSHHEPDPEHKGQIIWIWEHEGGTYPVEWTDEIRFRVVSVKYPQIPVEQSNDTKPFAPMVITGSLNADGLGPLAWWV